MVKIHLSACLRGSAGTDQGYKPYLHDGGAKTEYGLQLS